MDAISFGVKISLGCKQEFHSGTLSFPMKGIPPAESSDTYKEKKSSSFLFPKAKAHSYPEPNEACVGWCSSTVNDDLVTEKCQSGS